jgi:hypothetical protein
MAFTLQDSFTGDTTFLTLYGVNWNAQTFTAGDNYTITRVALELLRFGTPGNPGTVSVSIRATAAGPLPTGADLSSVATYNGNLLTTDAGGEVVNFDFTTPVALTSGTQYAIVVRATGGDGNNRLGWRRSVSSGYAGGRECYSVNSGSSWTGETIDCYFQTYSGSDVTFVDMEATVAMTVDVSGLLEVLEYIDMEAAVAMTMTVTGTLEANLVNTNNRIVLVALGHDELWYEDS